MKRRNLKERNQGRNRKEKGNIQEREFNKAKSQIFEKILKMDRSLARDKEKAQINVMNEKETWLSL